MQTRRDFLMGSAALAALPSVAAETTAPCAWARGHFQIHMIYTGTAESLFLIFPDATSLLLDCGDSNPRTFLAAKHGSRPLPILPSESRRAGEWIARYVRRVNPHVDQVDYMWLSHFHGDHSGAPCHDGGRSGFALAAETLHFRRALDRGWPDYADPLPYGTDPKWMGGSLALMKGVYARLATRDGLTVEKFRVGATGQIALLHDPAAFPDFSVFNLCGNGKVAMKDGTVVDCYAHEHVAHRTCVYDENAMSLGGVFAYGRFRFFTAGDFTASDGRKGMLDGRKTDIEQILARACGSVSVAKANHHAGWSCPQALVAALRPRVWLAPVWWQLQCDRGTMSRLADRAAYPGDRLILPGVFCRQRRELDAGMDFLTDIPEAVHTPSHVVIDVPPGGETFTVTCLDPADESLHVKAQWSYSS